jgi:hypothetical protein
MQLAADAIRGQISAHSFATGPAMAEPAEPRAFIGVLLQMPGTGTERHVFAAGAGNTGRKEAQIVAHAVGLRFAGRCELPSVMCCSSRT